MKIKHTIKALLLLMVNFAHAQNNNLGLSFYPLHNGNYWAYHYMIRDGWSVFNESYYSLEVIGDTTLNNNIKYKIILERYIPDTVKPILYYERIDSTNGNVYRYSDKYNFKNNEYLIDSLNIQVGDTSRASRIYAGALQHMNIASKCMDMSTEKIFNKELLVKDIVCISYVPGFNYRLAENIGLIRYYLGSEVLPGTIELIYAKIQGREYGDRIITEVKENIRIPIKCSLFQNFPNPFNSTTFIGYSISEAAAVDLVVYNIKGQIIQSCINDNKQPGQYTYLFDASGLPNGKYIYVLKSNKFQISRCLTLIK
jgi:hypothetical protein